VEYSETQGEPIPPPPVEVAPPQDAPEGETYTESVGLPLNVKPVIIDGTFFVYAGEKIKDDKYIPLLENPKRPLTETYLEIMNDAADISKL